MALHGGQLVSLASAPGSSRLDVVRSLNLEHAAESVSFLAKMRPEVASAAKDLEAWVAKQQTGLDLAAKADSTETLLKAGCRLPGWCAAELATCLPQHACR